MDALETRGLIAQIQYAANRTQNSKDRVSLRHECEALLKLLKQLLSQEGELPDQFLRIWLIHLSPDLESTIADRISMRPPKVEQIARQVESQLALVVVDDTRFYDASFALAARHICKMLFQSCEKILEPQGDPVKPPEQKGPLVLASSTGTPARRKHVLADNFRFTLVDRS